MIYIVTALQIEASPVIEYYRLKRDLSINEYQVYSNSEISLIVGGVGKVKSAMAAVYLLAKGNVSKKDILLNVGFCGAASEKYPIGSLLLINKVKDMDTDRDYYPDVFTGGNLPMEALYCCSRPIGTDIIDNKRDFFCDMESSGIMEAARKFIYAHNVVILKIISDYLTPEGLDKEKLKGYIREQMPNIDKIINELRELNDTIYEFQMKDEEELIDIISENLKFSDAMKQILIKEVKRNKLIGFEPLKVLETYSQIKVNSKAEGKKTLEQIIEEIKQRNI